MSGEEIIGSFYEKEFQKTSQKEKVLKRKGDKLYDNRFNSSIDKQDLEWNFLNKMFKRNLLNKIFKWNFTNEIF